MRTIACLSYRITPLNITSCGCRVQTYGVRPPVLSSTKYSMGFRTWFPVPAQARTTIHRTAQDDNIKVVKPRGSIFSNHHVSAHAHGI